MNTNLKIFAVLFINFATITCVSVFFALPRIKKIYAGGAAQFQTSQLDGMVLKSLDREYLAVSVFLILLAIVLLAASIRLVGKILQPTHAFIKNTSARFYPGGKGTLDEASAAIDRLLNYADALDKAPIGIMVVNSNGIITFFNREAGEITELDSAAVVGRSMIQFFPNNYYNYTIEVLKTGREYLALRNIIKAGGFLKELLFSISPLRKGEQINGAVAVFQDVTPQRKMIEVQAAYTLAKDLSTQKDLEGAMRVIAAAAAEMAQIEWTAVFLADPAGSLVIRASHGIPEEIVEKYNSGPLRVGSPEIKELYRNRVPLLHGDAGKNSKLKALLIIPETNSFYSFPIFHLDNLAGFLNLYSREKNKLSKDVIYLLQTISRQVNTAASNFYELQLMRTLASVDGLTGLLNRRRFQEILKSQFTDAGGKFPLSLAMIDIDHFKEVNDNYGHQFGDQILREIAALISRQVRENDIACRYGGEEFSVLMPGISENKALETVERIRTAVEGTTFYGPDRIPVKITVSAGLVSYPGGAATAEELILHADTALYTAKRTGRNRVIGYEPGQKITG